MTRIVLDWPPKELNPNARVHWFVKNRASKRYRDDAHILARANGIPKMQGRVIATITFRPPDKRRRDIDNMLASIKAGIDGIAGFIEVDDSNWGFVLRRGEPCRYGCIIIDLEAA